MPSAVNRQAESDPLFTRKEIATVAGVSLSTIRPLLRSGELPGVRVGRQVRIRLGDWQNYLEQHRTQRESALQAIRRGRAEIARR